MSIFQTASLTSRVMDAICRLPGVATLDWCDRAAAAIARLHHPCSVGLLLGSLDERGFVQVLTSCGVAQSQPPDAAGSSSPASAFSRAHPAAARATSLAPSEASATILERARSNYVQGEWLGWSPGDLLKNPVAVWNVLGLGLLSGPAESPVLRRWGALNPAEMLLGAALVQSGATACAIAVEVASNDPAFRSCEVQRVVLHACLPMLAQRMHCSLGHVIDQRQKWLTAREETIVWELASGKKVPQIARELGRSIYTVHDHVKNIHRKLGAKTRGQLVARALGHLAHTHAPARPAHADPAGAAPQPPSDQPGEPPSQG